jgi:hypothetical protein
VLVLPTLDLLDKDDNSNWQPPGVETPDPSYRPSPLASTTSLDSHRCIPTLSIRDEMDI